MPTSDTLVSVGLPVYNGERSLERAIRSVLEQDHDRLELVISDNASADGTEEICRHHARLDSRVRYNRQPENIGLFRNFRRVLELSAGTYFRWMGDDDWLAPTYLSRSLRAFAEDDRLILVTTQQAHVDDEGVVQTSVYTDQRLRSDRPVERFAEMLRLLTESYLLLDPLYGVMRRDRVVGIPRVNMLREDEIFAAKLALTGPFGHLPEILSQRGQRPFMRLARLAEHLGVPVWHAKIATLLQCRELLRYIHAAELTPAERQEARAAVVQLYLRRHRQTVLRRSRKLVGMVQARLNISAPSG